MNPSTENLLLREVQPRLRNAIHTVPAVGSDDPEELLQDGLVIALRLLNGTRRSRENVTAAHAARRCRSCVPSKSRPTWRRITVAWKACWPHSRPLTTRRFCRKQ